MHQQRLFDEHDDLEILLELKELSVEQQQKRILLYMAKKLQQILQVEQSNNGFLSQIVVLLTPPLANSLTIRSLTMQQFDPGATGIVLQAAFTPAGSTAPNPGFSVVWSDSNSFATFANDASDASGLTQDVSLSTSATVGTSGVITAALTGTFPDGTAASLTGTFNYTIGAAPVPNATGLGITQIA